MRGLVVVGSIVLAVVLLALANVFAVQTFDLMGEDAGGFVLFVNSIGVMALTGAGVGAVIVWRVPENRIGPLLIAGALLLQLVFVAWPLTVLSYFSGAVPPLVSGIIAWIANISILPALFLLLPTVGLLFPDGRLPSRRWRTPYAMCIVVLGVGVVLMTVAPWVPSQEQPVPNPFALPGVPTGVSEIGGALASIAVFAGFGLAVAGMVGRFRRGDAMERAQLKWFLAAVTAMGIAFPISFATDIGPADVIDLLSVLVGALIPLSIGVAILRYRLYDIDRLISRSVSWAIVTGLLISVFAGLVVGLQALLVDVTQGQTLAVAASTLAAFALFQPVRRRVQRTVDRRFDRARYDAERTAAAFADRLRDQVALETVAGELVASVRGTLQPSHAIMWLRERRR